MQDRQASLLTIDVPLKGQLTHNGSGRSRGAAPVGRVRTGTLINIGPSRGNYYERNAGTLDIEYDCTI